MARGFISGLITGAALGVVVVAAVSQLVDYRLLDRPSVAPPAVPAGSAFMRGREDAQPSLPATGGGRPSAPAVTAAPRVVVTPDGPPALATEGLASPQLITAPARAAQPAPDTGSAAASTLSAFDDGEGRQPQPAAPALPTADSQPEAVPSLPNATSADRPDAPAAPEAGRTAHVSGNRVSAVAEPRPVSSVAVAPQPTRPAAEAPESPHAGSASRPAVAAQARIAPPPGADAAPLAPPAADDEHRPAGVEREAPVLPQARASDG